jgi:NRPS condensation-like uncharacterized protein
MPTLLEEQQAARIAELEQHEGNYKAEIAKAHEKIKALTREIHDVKKMFNTIRDKRKDNNRMSEEAVKRGTDKAMHMVIEACAVMKEVTNNSAKYERAKLACKMGDMVLH